MIAYFDELAHGYLKWQIAPKGTSWGIILARKSTTTKKRSSWYVRHATHTERISASNSWTVCFSCKSRVQDYLRNRRTRFRGKLFLFAGNHIPWERKADWIRGQGNHSRLLPLDRKLTCWSEIWTADWCSWAWGTDCYSNTWLTCTRKMLVPQQTPWMCPELRPGDRVGMVFFRSGDCCHCRKSSAQNDIRGSSVELT